MPSSNCCTFQPAAGNSEKLATRPYDAPFSAIEVTPGRHCGEDEHLFAGDDPRPRLPNHLDLISPLPSRLSTWCPFKKLASLIKMLLVATLLFLGAAYSWPQKQHASYASRGPGPDGKYTLEAPGIRATFIPYGASISNLFINDTKGLSSDELLVLTMLTPGRH